MNPYKDRDLKEFYSKFSDEEIIEANNLLISETEKEYKDFITNFSKGKCYLCNKLLREIDVNRFCLHWFISDKQIKKKQFEKYLTEKMLPFSYAQLESYLRWVAETEKLFDNINDLEDEKDEKCMIHITIKYKNRIFTLKSTISDYEGHPTSSYGQKPHYHLQITKNEQIFIKFNDFHLLFSESDLFEIESLKQNPDKIKRVNFFGNSYNILKNPEVLKEVDKNLKLKDSDQDNGNSINTFTIVSAKNGTSISGDEISKAFLRSKEAKKPISNFLGDIENIESVTKMLYPGDSLIEMQDRTPIRKKQKKKK